MQMVRCRFSEYVNYIKMVKKMQWLFSVYCTAFSSLFHRMMRLSDS
jgi:hypothetical protein